MIVSCMNPSESPSRVSKGGRRWPNPGQTIIDDDPPHLDCSKATDSVIYRAYSWRGELDAVKKQTEAHHLAKWLPIFLVHWRGCAWLFAVTGAAAPDFAVTSTAAPSIWPSWAPCAHSIRPLWAPRAYHQLLGNGAAALISHAHPGRRMDAKLSLNSSVAAPVAVTACPLHSSYLMHPWRASSSAC